MADISLHTTQGLIAKSNAFKLEFLNDFNEAQNYSVSLDRDPTSKSPAELYTKMFEARSYSNRTSVLMLRYMKAYITLAGMLLRKEEERKLRIQALYAQKAKDLSSFRSTEEKNNFCLSFMSEEEKNSYIELKSLTEQVKGYYQYFKVKHEILSSTKNDILTQLGVIKSMIMLGELQLVNNLSSFKDIDQNDLPDVLNFKEGEILL